MPFGEEYSDCPHEPHEYRQSFTMKMYQSYLILSLTHGGKVEILKNRFGRATEKATIEEIIECVSEMLSCHVFSDCMKMFQEHMKTELIMAIKHIAKGGEIKCEPLSENEQSKWDSKQFQLKDSSDMLTDSEK